MGLAFDYQEFLDQIEQAMDDYENMSQEENDTKKAIYYDGMRRGLEEAKSLVADILEQNPL